MAANPPLSNINVSAVRPAQFELGASESALVRWIVSLVIPVFVSVTYLTFPTRNYYWDGISFAASIENSTGLSGTLIHPHHLLYNVFGYLVYQLSHLLGLNLRAVELLQITNGLLSGFCALLLFRFLTHTFRSRSLAGLLVIAFSFSATWWKYSTDADAYVPSVLFLIICLNLLFVANGIKPWQLAIAHTAAMCFHQLAVFFFPVIVIGILVNARYSRRERWRFAARYTGLASSMTLAVNYVCFHWQTGAYGLGGFWRWLTSYVQGPDSYSFSFSLLSNLGFTIRSQVRLFLEGRLNWANDFLTPPIVLLIAIAGGLALMLGWRALKGTFSFHPKQLSNITVENRLRPLVTVCLVWLGSYLIFLFFWYPYFTPYRLFCLPPLICLTGVFLFQRRDRGAAHGNAVMLVAVMAISNFVFFIFPLSHAEKYPPLAFALAMDRSWSERTIVYYGKSNADNQLVRYFNPRTSWRSLTEDYRTAFEDELAEVYRKGGNVWIETTVIDQMESSSSGKEWLLAHGKGNCRKEMLDGSYRMKYVQVFPLADSARVRSDCSLIAYIHEDTVK